MVVLLVEVLLVAVLLVEVLLVVVLLVEVLLVVVLLVEVLLVAVLGPQESSWGMLSLRRRLHTQQRGERHDGECSRGTVCLHFRISQSQWPGGRVWVIGLQSFGSSSVKVANPS